MRHIKHTIAVLVGRELGRTYQEIEVRALSLVESFILCRHIFGNIFEPSNLHSRSFECSAEDYIQEWRGKLPKTVESKAAADTFQLSSSAYDEVVSMPRCHFTANVSPESQDHPQPQPQAEQSLSHRQSVKNSLSSITLQLRRSKSHLKIPAMLSRSIFMLAEARGG